MATNASRGRPRLWRILGLRRIFGLRRRLGQLWRLVANGWDRWQRWSLGWLWQHLLGLQLRARLGPARETAHIQPPVGCVRSPDRLPTKPQVAVRSLRETSAIVIGRPATSTSYVIVGRRSDASGQPHVVGCRPRNHWINAGTLYNWTSLVTHRRRVDWPIILGPKAPIPKVMNRSARGKLASLLAAFDEIHVLDDPDFIIRRAVELSCERIGLVRAGIFVLDRARNLMLGTWGMDLNGVIVDEHQIMYDVSDTDREAFRRSDEEGAHFTVFENCPIVEHRMGKTGIAGQGWVACTPIRSTRAPIGMLFNDAGISDAPVDEDKQAHAAILCSLLGTILDPVHGSLGRGSAPPGESRNRRLAAATVGMLAKDPALGGKEISDALDISPSRLARVFKSEMGMSLVEYRNRLRLDRFSVLLDRGRTNLLGAALAAGFGSYAQFHRVFRALRRVTPREYLRRQT